MKAILLSILLIGMAGAVTPLDCLKPGVEPGLVDLNHIAPDSAKAMADMNDLGTFTFYEMPDIGHYASGTRYKDGGEIDPTMQKFLAMKNKLPANVNNATEV